MWKLNRCYFWEIQVEKRCRINEIFIHLFSLVQLYLIGFKPISETKWRLIGDMKPWHVRDNVDDKIAMLYGAVEAQKSAPWPVCSKFVIKQYPTRFSNDGWNSTSFRAHTRTNVSFSCLYERKRKGKIASFSPIRTSRFFVFYLSM